MGTRNEFLLASAAGAVALGVTAAAASAADATILDEAAFVGRIRSSAKHRQAIGAARADDGAVLQFAVNTLNGFQNGWHEPAANIQIAIVIAGSAVTLGLDDDAWRTFKLIDIVHGRNDSVPADFAQGNVWSHPNSALTPTTDRSIPALLARNVKIFCCNTALGDIANRIVAARKAAANANPGNPSEVQAELRNHVLPGCAIVPAGISSIAVLQENGYTYFSAAL
jgi:intracellular sulfur oxidation DsrE/DsrF family protein